MLRRKALRAAMKAEIGSAERERHGRRSALPQDDVRPLWPGAFRSPSATGSLTATMSAAPPVRRPRQLLDLLQATEEVGVLDHQGAGARPFAEGPARRLRVGRAVGPLADVAIATSRLSR